MATARARAALRDQAPPVRAAAQAPRRVDLDVTSRAQTWINCYVQGGRTDRSRLQVAAQAIRTLTVAAPVDSV
jgi:hypothetical protein